MLTIYSNHFQLKTCLSTESALATGASDSITKPGVWKHAPIYQST